MSNDFKTCGTCKYETLTDNMPPCSTCYGGVSNYAARGSMHTKEEIRMDVIGQNGNDGEHYAAMMARPPAVPTPDLAAYMAEQEEAAKKTAPGLLNRAADIMQERAKQYDRPEGERSMGAAVKAFNAITGRDLKESEGWLLLQVLKDVRQWQRPDFHADSAEDCIAYSALKAEALAKGL